MVRDTGPQARENDDLARAIVRVAASGRAWPGCAGELYHAGGHQWRRGRRSWPGVRRAASSISIEHCADGEREPPDARAVPTRNEGDEPAEPVVGQKLHGHWRRLLNL